MMSITGPMRMRQEDGAEDRVGVREGWSDKDMPEDNIELGGRRKRRREGEIDAMTSEKSYLSPEKRRKLYPAPKAHSQTEKAGHMAAWITIFGPE